MRGVWRSSVYFSIGVTFLIGNLIANVALALSVVHEKINSNQHSIKIVKKNMMSEQAKSWGLTLRAYHRYQHLMQQGSSSHWYRSLDPAEVLALNAEDDEEMIHYARVQAKNMHERVTRELRFNRFYRQAYRDLYPREKPIASLSRSFNGKGFVLMPGDRIWLFVTTSTPLGHWSAERLLLAIKNMPNTILDIYFVDQPENMSAIRQWAMAPRIHAALLKKRITLNMGARRFSVVTQHQSVRLPYAGILRQRGFQPINLALLKKL